MSNDFFKVLKVSAVLDYQDGPLIFTAEDAVGTRFLCSFLQTSEFGTEYLCVPVSLGRLNSFLKGTKDLRFIYEHAESQDFYKLITTQEEDAELKAKQISFDEINHNLLPDDGYFYDPVEYEETELERNRTLVEVSLDIPEARNATVINSYTLSNLLESIQDAIKYGYKKVISGLPQTQRGLISGESFYTFQVYSFSTSSFTIHLRSSVHSDRLFGDGEVDQAVGKVAELIRISGNPEHAINFLKQNKGHFVSSIKKLIKIPIDNKCELVFSSKPSLNRSPINRYILSYDVALKLQTALAAENELSDESVDYIGRFVDVITSGVKTKWRLRLESGEIVAGEIDRSKSITLSGVTISQSVYQIFCKEILLEDAEGNTRKKLLLYDYKEYSFNDATSVIP
jgi:hypothetical protein